MHSVHNGINRLHLISDHTNGLKGWSEIKSCVISREYSVVVGPKSLISGDKKSYGTFQNGKNRNDTIGANHVRQPICEIHNPTLEIKNNNQSRIMSNRIVLSNVRQIEIRQNYQLKGN